MDTSTHAVKQHFSITLQALRERYSVSDPAAREALGQIIDEMKDLHLRLPEALQAVDLAERDAAVREKDARIAALISRGVGS